MTPEVKVGDLVVVNVEGLTLRGIAFDVRPDGDGKIRVRVVEDPFNPHPRGELPSGP